MYYEEENNNRIAKGHIELENDWTNSDYYKSTKEIGFRTKDFKMHLTTEEEVRKDVTITFVEESLYE